MPSHYPDATTCYEPTIATRLQALKATWDRVRGCVLRGFLGWRVHLLDRSGRRHPAWCRRG